MSRPHAIPVNEVARAIQLNFVTPSAQGDDQLDFEMNLTCSGGIGELAIVIHDIVGIFLKEERRLACWVTAHLDCVIRVIATDAVDSVHREYRIGVPYSKKNGAWWSEDELVWHGFLVGCQNGWTDSLMLCAPFDELWVWYHSPASAVDQNRSRRGWI